MKISFIGDHRDVPCSCAECPTGNGDKLSSTQAEPGQAIKSAVAYFPSISFATSCPVALYIYSFNSAFGHILAPSDSIATHCHQMFDNFEIEILMLLKRAPSENWSPFLPPSLPSIYRTSTTCTLQDAS